MLYENDAVLMAPLAGYTDIPFRRMMRRHGGHYMFTEMVDIDSLIYNTSQSLIYVERDATDAWLALQLVGRDRDSIRKLAPRIREMGFDAIDFNLGCPAPKVAKKGEGAILARKEPDLAVACLAELVESLAPLPVTVKTRIVSDADIDASVRLMQRLEATGIRALTLHGRVMERFYSGEVFFDALKAVHDTLKIPVIANGGVMGIESYRQLRERSGCSRVMVARGAQGNPWIFDELREGDAYIPPTCTEFTHEFEHYLNDVIGYYGEELGLRVSRKTVLDFLRGRGFPSTLRSCVSYLSNRSHVESLLREVAKGPSPMYYRQVENTTQIRRIRPS